MCKGLPLTIARNAHNRISIGLHFQQLNHAVNVSEFRLRAVASLTHQGAEFKGLADGLGWCVDVFLLNVADLALEAGIAYVSVDANLADFASEGCPFGQHI